MLYISGYGIYRVLAGIFVLHNGEDENFLTTSRIFHCLYPLITLFALGNLNLFLNFLIPVKVSIFLIYSILLILLIYSFSLMMKNKFEDFQFISQIGFPLILSIASYGIQFHYDAGAYHLGYQNWIFSEKIVFGLSNINAYFSYGSINEYLYSIFTYFDINLFYFFVDLVFFVSFFGFMFDLLKQSENLFLRNSALIIFIYTALDNFGYSGGGNGSLQIQMVGKPDTAVGVLWVIVSLFIINDLIENKSNNYNFFLILLFSLFAFQLKVNAGPLIFMIIFYFLNFKNYINLFKFPNLLLYLMFLFFVLKNLIISGCLLYPLVGSCVNKLSWLNFNHIEESAEQTLALNKAISFNQDFFISFNNFITHQYNKQIYINFIGTLVIIYLFKKFIFKKDKNNTNIKIYFAIFLVLNYLLFFSTVPAFRNGFGLFTTTFLLFSINNLKIKSFFSFLFDRKIITVLVFSSLILFPRFFMYTSAIDNKFQFLDFDKKFQNYEVIYNNYVIPTESNQCWEVKNCLLKTSSNNEFKTYEKYSFKFIESFK